MRTFNSMAPLFRQSVGFDRFNDLFESALRNENAASYPPYNVEKSGEDHYRISVAVAGFVESELSIMVEKGVLSVSGGKHKVEGREDDSNPSVYLHQGIAQRPFKLSFRLADHIEVRGAALENGLLHIDLERMIPEEAKPRAIHISAEGSSAMKH